MLLLFPVCIFFLQNYFALFFPEAPAEEPKFIPFTGSGRRLDGKPSKDKDVLAPSPAKRQANATNGVQPSTATTSQGSSSRKTTGKLVFGSGSGGSRAEKVGLLQHFELFESIYR
jgi:hypothetical protein